MVMSSYPPMPKQLVVTMSYFAPAALFDVYLSFANIAPQEAQPIAAATTDTSTESNTALSSSRVWVSQASSRLLNEQSMSARHEQWIAHHGRVYKDADEKERRFKIFKDNVERVEAFNAGTDKGYKQ
ncbi:hypothetical protein RJ640_017332, partial [Escallonia rubra]